MFTNLVVPLFPTGNQCSWEYHKKSDPPPAKTNDMLICFFIRFIVERKWKESSRPGTLHFQGKKRLVSAKFRLWQVLPIGPDDLAEPVKSREMIAFRHATKDLLANSGLAIMHRLLGFQSKTISSLALVVGWWVLTETHLWPQKTQQIQDRDLILIQQSVKFDIYNTVPFSNPT